MPRSRWLASVATTLLLLSLAAAAAPLAGADPIGDTDGLTFDTQASNGVAAGLEIAPEQTLLDLTNADRVANGQPPLAFDPASLGIARQRAATQLQEPALTHYGADGQLIFVRLLADAGLDYQLAGENLARSNTSDDDVVPRVEQALMRSPTHRRNILEPRFARVAIGAASDANGRIAFAEIFRSE